MRYFLDNCLSFRYAGMLRALDVEAFALREELAENASDVEVFRYLRGRDLVFVTADRKQLVRVAEAAELKAAGISAMYFSRFWGAYNLWQQAAWLVSRWPRIDSVQQGVVKGTILELKQNGKSVVITV